MNSVIETPNGQGGSSENAKRRRIMLIVALLVLIIGVLVIALSRDDDKTSPTTTRDRLTSTSSTTAGGTGSVVPPSQVSPTAPAATTTKPTVPPPVVPSGPTLTAFGGVPSALTCIQANALGNSINVTWQTTNAASVTISIDGPGPYKTGLAPNGSEPIHVGCGDTQVIMITPYSSANVAGPALTKTVVVNA